MAVVPARCARPRRNVDAQVDGEPQTIAHLIVERSSSYWILFGIPKVEAHADIVEFRPAVNTGERARPKRPPPEPPD